MNSTLITFLQGILVLGIAPFGLGLVRTVKARLQGRRGASPFLPYVSFASLFRKEMVISPYISWVFRIVPFVVFGTALFLAFVLPLLSRGGVLAPLSDFVLVAGILSLGALFLVFGGIDPGTAFGGMGASREMTIAALLEPSLIMIFATFAVVSGSSNMDAMLRIPLIQSHLFLVLPLLSFVLISLAENARYPVDNPATHLELTMVHEAMVLEYSGPYLALLEYASAIKLTVFSLLIGNFVFPMSIAPMDMSFLSIVTAVVWFCAKVIVILSLLGFLESTIAKMRFFRMQEYLSAAFFIALFGMVVALIT